MTIAELLYQGFEVSNAILLPLSTRTLRQSVRLSLLQFWIKNITILAMRRRCRRELKGAIFSS
jgi:hypothetical protein